MLASVLPEPARQRVNALMVAGAGAAYISGGGFGLWELAFTTVVTVCAYLVIALWLFLGAPRCTAVLPPGQDIEPEFSVAYRVPRSARACAEAVPGSAW